MARQLVLIEETGADYRLDEHTREIGRRGVAAARAALRNRHEAESADTANRQGKTAA